MIEPKDALDRLHRANLLRTRDTPSDDELAAVAAECERRVAVAKTGRTEELLRPTTPARPRWRPALVFSLAFAVVIAAAGVFALFNDSGGRILEPDVANTPPSTTPVPSGTIGNVAYVDELVYYADAEHTLHMSVFYPIEGDGPFPVVVAYGEFQMGHQERALSRRIAERGAVVFAPIWADSYPPTLKANDYLAGGMWERAACAVGFAQAQAGTYGGEPERTTVVGDAGGEHPATWVALGLADTSSCAEPIRFQPTGLVAGQGQWLFQEEQFDDVFVGPNAVGIETVDSFFNSERWDHSEQLGVFLWATAWTGNSAEVDDPPAEDSWIWSRDPDGDIIDDLAEVDAFADGLITFSDNARLMNLRMTQADIDVSYYEAGLSGYSLDEVAFESLWRLIIGG